MLYAANQTSVLRTKPLRLDNVDADAMLGAGAEPVALPKPLCCERNLCSAN